jgi:hypothetical protein
MGAYGGEENCGWLPPATLANFAANPTSGKRPLTVDFTDLSSGSNTYWSWIFGDGDSSSVQNPTHTYNDTGLFTVSLTVAGPYGSDDTTMVDLIHVTEPPAMYLTVIPDTTAFPRGGELGFHVTATNNTQGTLSVEAWSDVTLPWGRLISPFGGPLPVNFGPGYTLEMHVSQGIPPIAPLGGPYLYCVSFGSFPDSILVQDCFEFDVVLGAD